MLMAKDLDVVTVQIPGMGWLYVVTESDFDGAGTHRPNE